MTLLLADCGNTAIKCALLRGWQGSRPLLGPLQALPSGDDAALHECCAQASELLLLPGSRRNHDRLAAQWHSSHPATAPRVLGEAPWPLPDLGQYVSCGVDRLCAGVAATLEQSTLVIDAGTATTLTAWQRGTDGPRFMGGLILPGALACAQGLSHAAPALPLLSQLPLPPLDPCAHDTPSAMGQALAIGYPAMVRACAEALATATGISTWQLTGGDAPRLQSILGNPPVHPNLVLEGLAILAREAGMLVQDTP